MALPYWRRQQPLPRAQLVYRWDLDKTYLKSEFERLSAGGQRSESERLRFQEVSRRLDELKRATTGSRAQI